MTEHPTQTLPPTQVPGPPSTPGVPPSGMPADTFPGSWSHQAMGRWLTDRRNAGVHPDRIAADLVGAGWDADSASRLALRSLRSSDRQTLTYATLNVTAGLAALGAASSAHLLIAGNPDPLQLTSMLTLWLIATPIALWVGVAARRAEQRSPFVMWSGSRRGWFGALAFCTGLVGIVRLLTYVFLAIATLTGASTRDFTVESAAQVAVSLAVSVPMFCWSFREWRRSNLVIAALGDDRE